MALTKHNERYGPYMTANNAPAPYAATASQNSWGAFRAFSESLDDDISFTGLAAGTEQWVQITLDKAIRIWAFRIACRTTVSAKDAGQVPKNFKVQGSTDGTTFENIQAYTDVDWSQFTSWDATNNKYDWGDSKKIEISCAKEYQYYRFSFGECQSVSTQKLGSMTPTSSNTVKVTLIDMYQAEGEAGPEITGIRITYPPDKKRYEIGEALDTTGLEVMADMSDGKAQAVTDYTLSGYDSATTGQKTVTVTYQGHTATFDVTVYELSSIAITTPPAKVQYNVGDELDLTGMVVMATYSDGVTGVVAEYSTSGFDSSVAGTCTVAVTYQVESASFGVTIKQQGITLESLLDTTDKMMAVHDKFTSSNVEIDGPEWFIIDGTPALKIEIGRDASVRFNKDVSKRIELCAAGIRGSISKIYTRYGFITGDVEFYKVRVEGSSAYYSSEIAPEKEIKYEMVFLKSGQLVINWIKAPETAPSYNLTVLSYLKLANQQLMLPITGVEPVVFTIKRIDVAGTKWGMEIACDSVEELTGTLGGMDLISSESQLNKKITVAGAPWLEFDGAIADTIYLDTNGRIGIGKNTTHIEVFYKTYGYFTNIFRQEGSLNNGTRFLKFRIHGYYSWQGDTNKKIELFLLEDGRIFYYVIESPTNPAYLGSSSFHYGDVWGSLDIPAGTVNKPIWFYLDNSNKLFAIKYGYESPITGMQVSKQPAKTVFYKGDESKFDGMQVSLAYKDNSLAQISKCLVHYTDEIGQQEVKVTFGAYSTSFLADIIEDTVDSLGISLELEHFIVGQELHGVTVTATYKTGKTKTVAPEEYSVVEFDTSTTGEKSLRISYEECEASLPIVVTESADFTLDISEYVKLKYLVGIDDFDSDGISGTIVFSDGYEEYVYSDEMNFSGFSNESIGPIAIMVEYGGFTADFQVEVSDTIAENIGADNITDVVASLNVVSGILTVTGIGDTKNFSHSRGDDLFGGGYSEYAREIVIGEGITKLGSLFPYYHEVTKVTLPSTLAHIQYQYTGCFENCEKLKEINIPELLTVINGFRGCAGLTDIELGENVAEIGDGCFYDCRNLVVTIKNKGCVIYDEYSMQVKLIKGYPGSTAEEYAFANEIPFELIGTVISISVSSLPYKTTYFVLEKELDTSGLKIQGVTDSGGTVTVTTYSVSTVDFSTTGIKTVTISYNGFLTSFNVNVINPSFESICNSTTGMSDGTTASAPWFMYNGVAAESISCKNGTLRFNGAADGISVCARAYPYESYYSYMLETILDNGIRMLKFRTHYLTKNRTSAHVEHEIFLFSTNDIYVNVIRMPDDGSTVGDIGSAVGKLVSNGKEYNFNFKKGEPAKRSCYHLDDAGLNWNIKAEAYAFPTAPSRIEITKLPDKVIYLTGENLELSGMVVSLFYDNGTVEETTKYTVSGFDSSVYGTKIITITYQLLTTTFEVQVYDIVQGIRISRYPDKVYYKLGEPIDTAGLEVVIIKEDGKERVITDYTLSALDSSTTGSKQITVTYEVPISADTKAVYFAEFSVKVTATGDNPFEDNLTPYKITVHWINGEFTDLGNDDLTGTMTLQESICSNDYFIFGGCISNMIEFTTHAKQFIGADEEATPRGDIEVYVESKGTKVKIFTGTISSSKRTAGLTARKITAYDYLYRFSNTDIAWWYKNKTADKNMILTQKQFRDSLFDYLGIEQVPAKLYYDDALVPDTNQSNEINVASVLKDLCLQNSVFGWVSRDGKFEYLKLPHNSRVKSMDNAGNLKYAYYDAQIYVDTYESCEFTEGRIWYPKEFLTDPPVGMFTPGGLTAQEAYEANVYYNRNSFFVGDADWLDSAFQGDEYGAYTVMEPIFPVCYGTTSKTDNQHLYRAQGYTLTLRGNPLNKVGDSIEITVRKTAADGTQLEWVIHSYIMSRTLKLTGDTSMTDVYTAKNGPYNGNDSQAGNNTAEHSAELFRLRSEGPTISYAPFTDGAPALATEDIKKDRLRCVKRISKADYDAATDAGNLRTDTLYLTWEE